MVCNTQLGWHLMSLTETPADAVHSCPFTGMACSCDFQLGPTNSGQPVGCLMNSCSTLPVVRGLLTLPLAVAAMEHDYHVEALGCLRDLEQPLKEATSEVSPVLTGGVSWSAPLVSCSCAGDAGRLCLTVLHLPAIMWCSAALATMYQLACRLTLLKLGVWSTSVTRWRPPPGCPCAQQRPFRQAADSLTLNLLDSRLGLQLVCLQAAEGCADLFCVFSA